MRTVKDTNGTRRRVYEEGDGIRRRYRDALSDTRQVYPSRDRVNHPIGWYLDGHVTRRPLYGILSLANLAEYFLYHAKFGKRKQERALSEATAFFAATRRTMRNVLDTYRIDYPLKPSEVEHLRGVCDGLVELARTAHAAVSCHSNDCVCPACLGKRISVKDARLLEAILMEQSANGTIPNTSDLYRVAT